MYFLMRGTIFRTVKFFVTHFARTGFHSHVYSTDVLASGTRCREALVAVGAYVRHFDTLRETNYYVVNCVINVNETGLKGKLLLYTCVE